MPALSVFPTKVCRHIGQQDVFAEIVFDNPRHIRVHDLVVCNACAGRVCNGDMAVLIDLHQPGHAQRGIGAKDGWIEKVRINAPIQHVNALKPAGRPHRHKAIGNREVTALDQFYAHLLREKSVFKIGRVVDAGREHGNSWRSNMRGGQRAQGVEQMRGIIIDMPHVRGRKNLWEDALENFSIFQHIRHARRAAQIVFEDVKLTVLVAHEVDAKNVAPHAFGGRKADARSQKFLGRVDDVTGNDAVFEDFLIGVDVGEKEVEGLDALFEALFDIRPIRVRDDARDNVEGKNFLNAGSAAIHVEGDAHVQQRQFSGLMPFLEFAFRERSELFNEQPRAGVGDARCFEEFVVKSIERVRRKIHGVTMLKKGGL